METKNHRVMLIDDADKILQEYSKNSDQFVAHLASFMADMPNKLNDLPIKIKSLSGIEDLIQGNDQISYQFSLEEKAQGIVVENEGKSARIEEGGIGGVVFVNKSASKSAEVRKINFKITGSVSDSISIGVGDVTTMKNVFFVPEQMENEGLFGICAMGINISDIESPTFVFSKDDVIELTFEVEEARLLISRRNGIEKE